MLYKFGCLWNLENQCLFSSWTALGGGVYEAHFTGEEAEVLRREGTYHSLFLICFQSELVVILRDLKS